MKRKALTILISGLVLMGGLAGCVLGLADASSEQSLSLIHISLSREPAKRQYQADSLTGAVASERVTEAPKGTLRMDGNHSQSATAEGCMTARVTIRAERKVGLSDPAVLSGKAVA